VNSVQPKVSMVFGKPIIPHPLAFDSVVWHVYQTHSWTVSAAVKVFDRFPTDRARHV
jgi:hypothetical protein